MRMRKLFLTSVCVVAMGTAAVAMTAGCGGNAEQTFLFSAEQFYDGTTYKLNLRGMSDGSCTLNCLQASPQINLEGNYKFTEGKGYDFTFGGQTFKSGYNTAKQEHYLIYDLAMTSSYEQTIMMTFADAEFTPASGYVDPYEAAAKMTFKTLSVAEGGVEGAEEFKLLDNGTSFYVFSYGDNDIFYSGSAVEKDGVKTYTTYDGEVEIERVESEVVSGAYYVNYQTSAGLFSKKNNYMFYLNGSTLEQAFPDLDLSGNGGGGSGGGDSSAALKHNVPGNKGLL